MSDTTQITVPFTSWVDVSNSGTNGLITNEGNRRIKIIEDATQPAASVNDGHSLQPGDYVRFSLTGSQKVWARSTGDQPSEVAVTIE